MFEVLANIPERLCKPWGCLCSRGLYVYYCLAGFDLWEVALILFGYACLLILKESICFWWWKFLDLRRTVMILARSVLLFLLIWICTKVGAQVFLFVQYTSARGYCFTQSTRNSPWLSRTTILWLIANSLFSVHPLFSCRSDLLFHFGCSSIQSRDLALRQPSVQFYRLGWVTRLVVDSARRIWSWRPSGLLFAVWNARSVAGTRLFECLSGRGGSSCVAPRSSPNPPNLIENH